MKISPILEFFRTLYSVLRNPWFRVIKSSISKTVLVILVIISPSIFSLLSVALFARIDFQRDDAFNGLIVRLLVVIGVIGFSEFRYRGKEIDRELHEQHLILVREARAKEALKKLAEENRLREEAERPARVEAELAEVKAMLAELTGGRTGSSSSQKSTFTGSIKTEENALKVLELSKPYTLQDLKTRRKKMLVKVHPDHGGSNFMMRLVIEAYELLEKKI